MASITQIFLLCVPVLLFIGFFTLSGSWRGLAPLVFWSLPLGAAAPWFFATLTVLCFSMFASDKKAQAAGMSVLFPMLGMLCILMLSPFLSLFIALEASAYSRFLWATVISGVPALLLTGYLLYLMMFE